MMSGKALSAKRALVLFSGGQDSTTCLAFALSQYDYVETVGFHYGQRNDVELRCRLDVLDQFKEQFPDWGGKLGPDQVLELTTFSNLSQSALIDGAQEITTGDNGLPTTFVPGRNLFFFQYAGVIGYNHNLGVLVGGMCQTDYSGYPDCRDETLKQFNKALNLGMDTNFEIYTPLMWSTKAESWSMAQKLGGERLVDIIKRSTHTCYNGVRDRLYEWGYGCTECPACLLRAQGYNDWQSSLEC